MVKLLAAIKLRSIWNTLKSQVAILVLSILGYLYFLGIVVTICIGLVMMMASDFELAPDVMVGSGALVTLAWVLVPVLFASQEGTLDPNKLPPYLSYSRRLSVALVLVTGVGIAGIYFALFCISQITGWAVTGSIPAIIMSIIGVFLGVAVSWIWTRAIGAWAGRRRGTGRTSRDRTAILTTFIILLVFAPMGIWLPMAIERLGTTAWTVLLGYVKWTPFGAPWALPQAAAAGKWADLAVLLTISLATVALGWWFWVRQLSPAMTGARTPLGPKELDALAQGRLLVDPEFDAKKSPTDTADKGDPRYLPGVDRWTALGVSNQTAAIAERTWLYWLRDPRLSAQLISVATLVIFAVLSSTVLAASLNDGELSAASFSGMGIGMIILSSLTLGALLGTLLQYDSTALWIEVAIGTKGRHDRAGRLLGSLPFTVALTAVSAGAYGVFTKLPVLDWFYLFAAMLAVFTSVAAVATVIGSQWIYPVQPPGTSPMSTKGTGQFLTTMIIGLVQFSLGLVACFLPVGLLAWGYLSDAGWTIFAAVFALLWSIGVSFAGVFVGGKIFDRTQVELLTKIAAWPGHRITV